MPDEALLAEELVGRDLPLDAGNDAVRTLSLALPPGSYPALARRAVEVRRIIGPSRKETRLSFADLT